MKQLIVMGRLWAMMVKEFIHIRRDRVTIGMLITIPLIQLVLFGYAINRPPAKQQQNLVSSAIFIFMLTTCTSVIKN